MTGSRSQDWTELLVGHVLPDDVNLHIVSGASTHFGSIAMQFRQYEDQMHLAWSDILIDQEGRVADAGRAAFQKGSHLACETAEKYEVIERSNNSAHNSASELRSVLLTIAESGNSRIREIQQSKVSLPIKVGQITEVVLDCQTQANAKAAACAGNMLSDIQHILDKQGLQTSAQQFANDNGFDTTRMFGSPNGDAIRQQVEKALDDFGSPQSTQALGNPIPPPDSPPSRVATPSIGPAPPPESLPNGPTSPPPMTSSPNVGPAPQPRVLNPPAAPPPPNAVPNLGAVPSPQPGSASPTGGSPAVSLPNSASIPAPTPGISALPPPAGAPVSGLPASALPSMPPPTPTSLAQSFSQGFQTSAPIGSAIPPLTTAAPTFADPPTPMTPPVAQTFPSTAHAPALDMPSHTPAVAPAAVPAQPAEAGTAFLAGPAPPPMPITSTAAPVGPLPSYGSDIRPPASTAPAAPTAPAGPAPAAASSAPANTPGGNINQPAVVRQHPTAPPTPSTTPASISAQAVATTTAGAGAGHSSTQATARARLQSLVYAVARQEPRLRWAVGDRIDQSTVLVTDLASGWIPPGVDLPTGVKLLKPLQRRGEVEALLGEVTTTATYTPGQHLPLTPEPVRTTPRARHGLIVDELGWELSQATKWRDGLPRLAHTLANAAARATGVLPSEIDLLREHLDSIRVQVLTSYPDHDDCVAIQNWQLLATIEALALEDRDQACYHFAWFQALDRATVGGHR